mgnify:FL=1
MIGKMRGSKLLQATDRMAATQAAHRSYCSLGRLVVAADSRRGRGCMFGASRSTTVRLRLGWVMRRGSWQRTDEGGKVELSIACEKNCLWRMFGDCTPLVMVSLLVARDPGRSADSRTWGLMRTGKRQRRPSR